MSLDEKLREYVQDNFTSPDSSIYHYTKPDLGKKIIDSRVLWLSSHLKLNKKNNREFKVGPEIIKNKLKKTSIEKTISKFDEYILNGLKGYIASFCKDNNYEHAKTEYGTYCIGFKNSYLQQFRTKNKYVLFGNVIYEKKEQERIISEMIQLHEEYQDYPGKKLEDLMIWLSIVIPFLKEEVDHHDNECRIVTAEIMDKNDPHRVVGQSCIKEIKFGKNDIFLASA